MKYPLLFAGLFLVAPCRGQDRNYVPAPRPARTDYHVGCLYFAGWETDSTRNPWAKIVPFPERKPLLGWYDEGSPEVADWEIKWAVEHGITYFTYCWYRKTNNLGRPVTDTTHHHEHALHEGFLRAKFRDRMKFSILWENQGGAGVSSLVDLQENVFPYWLKTYFKHPSYLVIDGKPVLHFYNLKNVIRDLGGVEATRRAVAWMSAECEKAGFKGVTILTDYRWDDDLLNAGLSASYVYAITGKAGSRPTAAQVINTQLRFFDQWLTEKHRPMIGSANVGWDPMPWARKVESQPWYDPDKMARWRLTPAEFEELLRKMKTRMDSLPTATPGHRMILLSNWNEWGEGMHIAPHAQEGFGYLQAVRKVFTKEKRDPKRVVPADVGLGPYDARFRKFNPSQP